MNWKSGLIRMAVVALLAWWAICGFWYFSAKDTARRALSEYWNAQAGSTQPIIEHVNALESAKLALSAAIIVPLAVLLLVVLGGWIAAGFRKPSKQPEE